MIKKIVAVVAMSALAVSAQAQHAHSDIEVHVDGGALEIENGILLTSGAKLFESEFGELLNPYEADEPGFEADDGMFMPNEILGFEALGTLQYWNGLAWGSTLGGETLTLIDTLGSTADTIVSSTGVTNGIGFIGQADAGGGVHDHFDFEIGNGGGTPANGAYLLELRVRGFSDTTFTTDLYTPSDSFFIAFNLGLEESAFEASIDALGVAIPIPAAWLLMLSGLAPLYLARRRK